MALPSAAHGAAARTRGDAAVTTAAIRTRGLTRRFGTVTAVDRVDLSVAPGEIYGFLGRNGAGKTTLIRALLGLITPTAGEVTVLGATVAGGSTPAALWARVGYLVEGPGLYPTLTVLEHLHMAARHRGLPAASVVEAVDRLDLGRFASVRARALSMGNRQRLGLALALVHRPDLLILDEPGNGLDPAGVVDLRNLLRGLADDGVTVFMSTHIIGEVARLADRIGIIHAGRLIEEIPGGRFGTTGGERLVADFRSPAIAVRAAEALCSGGLDAQARETSLVSTAPDAVRRPDQVATMLVEAAAPPTYLAVEHEDLEQHFLRLTEGCGT